MNLRANIYVVPITLVVVTIGAVIFGVTGLKWNYYVIGAMVGLLNHGLMVKQNARTFKFAKLDPEHTAFNPKKSAILWYLARCILFIGIFVTLAFMADFKNNSNAIWDMVIALGGYLTMKVVFIICLLCFKDSEKEKKVSSQ